MDFFQNKTNNSIDSISTERRFDDFYWSGMNDSLWNSSLMTELTSIVIPTTSTRSRSTQSSINLDAVKTVVLAFNRVLIPMVTIVGFIGNILSIVLIGRDGVRKSSNILLIALAISDTMFLVGNSYMLVYHRYLSATLTYGALVNNVIYYSFLIFYIVMTSWAFFTSCSIPVLITLERLCAIFFPLNFHLMITPSRTFILVLFVFIYQAVYPIFFANLYIMTDPLYINATGKTYQFVILNRYLYPQTLDTMSKFYNEMSGTVPMIILVLGCLLIGFKVKQAAIRRARMISQGDPEKDKKNARASRTTKTLLAVCVTFVVLEGIVYILDSVKVHTDNIRYEILWIMDTVKLFIISTNCSSNFFIYIVSNKKFKDQLSAILKYNQKSV